MVIEKQIIEKIRPLTEVRLFIYDLLRCTFLKEPTLAFFKQIDQEFKRPNFPFRDDNEQISKGVERVKNFVNAHDSTCENVYNILHWDYTRLFIGPDKLPAPPWESTYRNKERLLFQEETLVVRKAYLKYSFLPVEIGHEADDHVGLELDFMFRLNEIAVSKLEHNGTSSSELRELFLDQKHFLEEHLLKWIPAFSEAIIQNANTDLYRGMAELLNGFLTLDLKALNELLDI